MTDPANIHDLLAAASAHFQRLDGELEASVVAGLRWPPARYRMRRSALAAVRRLEERIKWAPRPEETISSPLLTGS